ncbi:MAG: hypothetical protein KY450_03865 [Actinobacteria bacterium]|nr:hypothetical protein [Actinomycetota bacterium]
MPKRRALVAACALLVVGCGSEAGSDLLAGADRNVTLDPPVSEVDVESTPDPSADAAAALAADQAGAFAAWQAYQAAVLDRDGEAASAVVSRGTHNYYAALLDAALHATEAELDQLPVVDVTTVLIARFRYSAGQLDALDGRGFMALTVDDGLIDDSTAEGVTFDQAEIVGDSAVLRTSAADQKLRMLQMRREDGAWKVHLVAAVRDLGQPLDRFAREQSLSPTAASLTLLRRSAPEASSDVLQPLQPRR